MKHLPSTIRTDRLPSLLCALCFTGLSAAANAQISIAESPLFVTSSIPPNVMFIIDDSGSMQWETMPDEFTKYWGGNLTSQAVMWVFPRVANLHGGSPQYANNRTVRFTGNMAALFRSPQNNTVYYNPSVTYKPWSNPDGTLMPDASITAAPNRPLFPTYGTRDLTTDRTQTRDWLNNDGSHTNEAVTFYPSVYYWYNSGPVDQESSYTRVEIRSTTANYTGHGRENRTDCAGAATATCTYNEEIQNFANWYSYHRNRIFAARGGIGRAFAKQGEDIRIGYGAINKDSTTIDGVSTRTVVRGVRPFRDSTAGNHRSEFFDELYKRDVPAAGTPLRRALQGVGEYYRRSDNNGPWSDAPGTGASTPHLECRQSYAILMTDGYWNGADPDPSIGNADGTDGPVILHPDGTAFNYQYTPSQPFSDTRSNTLADVAMHYWKTDLRPAGTTNGLANRVPTSSANEPFWQHMVTYGVGLGVTGDVDPATAFAAARNGTAIAWGDPFPSSATNTKIDDLLHAAVNSRGGFFSASDPETFANELSSILSQIVARVEESSTAAAASSAILQTDTLLYVAAFRSTDWSGEFKAYEINSDGSRGALEWDAEVRLRSVTPSARKIFTTNPANTAGNRGVTLTLGSLSTAQQAALNRDTAGVQDNRGNERVQWIRGVENSNLRSRVHVSDGLRLLGDIVNSNPQYVGRQNYGYRFLAGTEGTSYTTFRATAAYQNRPNVIYVGSNNGLMHALDAQTGQELFAYMPAESLLPRGSSLHARINELMVPEYDHRFFMDGELTIGDAYVNGSWKTILIGTMGAGGRTVFALDVTDPTNFDATKVLWEFTHPELGYNPGKPSIVRMRNGTWAAVFGNGYNSSSGQASLFIVRLSDGQLMTGTNPIPTDSVTNNGLTSPQPTDWPVMDLSARWIYAGDLQGRMWRFDVSSTNTNQWDNNGNRKVLFQARDPSNTPQPITSQPALAADPNDPTRLIVLFGTGSFFRTVDGNPTNPQLQSLYGLFDQSGSWSISSRSELQMQTITFQGSVTFTLPDSTTISTLVRQVSNNSLSSSQKGWYLDLSYLGSNTGERVISSPTFPSGIQQSRVRFTTLIPDNDPCGAGRTGFVMDIDLLTGGRTTFPVFDLNQDGTFDANDMHNNLPISGIGGVRGERLTVIRDAASDREFLYGGEDLVGVGLGDADLVGRRSWRQFR